MNILNPVSEEELNQLKERLLAKKPSGFFTPGSGSISCVDGQTKVEMSGGESILVSANPDGHQALQVINKLVDALSRIQVVTPEEAEKRKTELGDIEDCDFWEAARYYCNRAFAKGPVENIYNELKRQLDEDEVVDDLVCILCRHRHRNAIILERRKD